MPIVNALGQTRVGIRAAVAASQTSILLLDSYSGAAAAYSLRKLRNTYTGSAIQVRRTLDNAEQNIGFDTNGNLDTQSLLSFNENGAINILDSYSVAAGAWSLRKLKSSYSGPAIRVRRTSDSQESDISFDSNGNLNTTVLLQFVGSNSGRVVKIYDQSGNGNDFVQPTAASQPHIVYQGTLNTLNGKPAILFNTTLSPNNHFTVPNSTSTFKFLHDGTNSFINYVGSFGLSSNPGTNYTIIDNGGTGSKNTGFHFSYVDSGFNDAMNVSISRGVPGYGNGATHTLSMLSVNYLSPMVQHILSILVDADNATGSQRTRVFRASANEFAGNSNTTTPSTGNSTFDLHLGAYLYDGVRYDYLNGNFQELVIFSSDQVSTRLAITSNVNYYYSNYTSSNSSFVKTWYDQIGSNNFIQSNNASQPKIVSSGSVITLNNKPTISFGTQNDYWYLESTSNFLSLTPSPISIFGVWKITDYSNSNAGVFGPSDNFGKGIEILQLSTISRRTALRLNGDGNAGGNWGMRNDNSGNAYQLWDNSTHTINSFLFKSDSVSVYKNTTAVSLTNGSGISSLTAVSKYALGRYASTESGNFYSYMDCQELLFYTSDQTTNRNNIISNINLHYSVYTPMITDGLAINLDAGNLSSYSGTGTSWVDLTGNNRNGTLVNGVSYSSNNGGCLIFDGVDDYVSVANTQACLGLKTNFTIEVWVKITNTTRFNTLFSYGDNWNFANDIIFFVNGNQICAQVNNGADGGANAAFTSTGWNQLTMVFDGTLTGNANRLKIYVNGVQQTLDFGSYNVPTNNGLNSTSAGIGGYSTAFFSNNYLGSIAINRLYTKSLSQSEISQNYTVTKSRFGL